MPERAPRYSAYGEPIAPLVDARQERMEQRPANQQAIAALHEILRELWPTILCRGWYGAISLEITVENGTIAQLLEDLATALQTAGVGTVGTNLFMGLLPSEPNNAVALFETSGLPPVYTHHGLKPSYERPAIQILVRHQDYAAGRATIQQAYDALCNLTQFLAIQPVQAPFALARDEHNRPRFAVNFTLMTRVED
jgi:hypothetical protein